MRRILALFFGLASLCQAQVYITNVSGSTITNQPVSIAMPFRDNDIPGCVGSVNFAQEGGTFSSISTVQTDAKNRFTDGSLKFAVGSFVIPSLAAGAIGIVQRVNGSCNNTGFLTQAQMLGANFNFDATISLVGTASPSVSARAILTAAGSCNDPGSDPESGQFLCTYILKGPVVTAVLLEDRLGRTFDMNTDGGTGNPLHPQFEVWFYPGNNAVMIGVTLENMWASTTATQSARDQTYSATIKIGNTSPTTVLTSGSIKQQTRTRWHRVFWLNQADINTLVTVDHNWGYLSQTGHFLNWDPSNPVTPTTLSAGSNPVRCTPAFYATEQQGLAYTSPGQGGDSVGCIPTAIAATGANEFHGALPTWDIAYLMTQDPGYRKVSYGDGSGNPGHGDLVNEVPYFYREADANAGHGQHYDTAGLVSTQGRAISINARTQVALNSTVPAPNCNSNFAADYINFGTGGEDLAPWGANNLDTTHEGNAGYVPYLMTGQFFYYETVMFQAAYAIALGPGNRACAQATGNSNLRNGSAGYYYNDQERGQTWIARDNALAAYVMRDGSPEQAYFQNFLKQNISVWQGARGLANDYPANSTAYNYGATSRNLTTIGAGSFLGSWTQGVPAYVTDVGSALNQSGTNKPASANAHFQNAYSALVIAWIDDMGFTPSGNLRAFMANRYLNEILNPAANIFDLGSYVYPTQDNAGLQTGISSWANDQLFYATKPTAWGTCNVGVDESAQYTAQGATSLYYRLTSSQGGFSGAAAWTKLVSSANCGFTSGSPKWDLTPRVFNPGAPSNPTVPAISFSPAQLAFSTANPSNTITITNTGTATLIISNFALSSGYTALFNTPCVASGNSLNVGQSCTVTITWGGSVQSGTFTVTDNAAGSPHIVQLTGLSQAPGMFAILGHLSGLIGK